MVIRFSYFNSISKADGIFKAKILYIDRSLQYKNLMDHAFKNSSEENIELALN